jgi:mono/diheme cytochrome c family protein
MLFLLSVANSFAGESSGAQEYKDNCARCHGPEAKGNGPDANEKAGYRPADLTQIARRHGGKFPREQIYDVIDGGKRIPGHYDFDSPMPLWGLGFQIESKQYSQESEAVVRRRIDSLLDYLQSIQQK